MFYSKKNCYFRMKTLKIKNINKILYLTTFDFDVDSDTIYN